MSTKHRFNLRLLYQHNNPAVQVHIPVASVG